MFLTVFIIVLAVLVVGSGVFLTIRRRRAADYDERLQSRDDPGRAHNEGQAKAAVGLSVRNGGSKFGMF